jgi:hypothetical protein
MYSAAFLVKYLLIWENFQESNYNENIEREKRQLAYFDKVT